MNELENKEMQETFSQKTEQLKQKANEIEQQISSNINDLLRNTAEKLDQAADKMHNTAQFFRDNNVSSIRENVSGVVKKNPGKSMIGSILIGFLIGKIIFR